VPKQSGFLRITVLILVRRPRAKRIFWKGQPGARAPTLARRYSAATTPANKKEWLGYIYTIYLSSVQPNFLFVYLSSNGRIPSRRSHLGSLRGCRYSAAITPSQKKEWLGYIYTIYLSSVQPIYLFVNLSSNGRIPSRRSNLGSLRGCRCSAAKTPAHKKECSGYIYIYIYIYTIYLSSV